MSKQIGKTRGYTQKPPVRLVMVAKDGLCHPVRYAVPVSRICDTPVEFKSYGVPTC